MRHAVWTAPLVLCLAGGLAVGDEFRLAEGDRVVLLGNTLIEREQRYGYWEFDWTARQPGLIVRNLGWSGDTVWGEARARFGGPADGFKHLKEHVLALKPTVLVIGYGGNEAFDGPEGLARFRQGLGTLLDTLAPTKARVVLLGPPRHEDMGRPLPEPVTINRHLAQYRDTLREVAQARGLRFADLYDLPTAEKPRTDNGQHFTAFGYWSTAADLARGLDWQPSRWNLEVTPDKVTAAQGLKAEPTAPWTYRVTEERLHCPAPDGTPPERFLQAKGLPGGRHTLLVDGKPLVTAGAGDWANGVALPAGPEAAQAEQLRATIVAKNRLYFYRWRPQNETYLFGFRKHEQGQNAREIPLFDPLVAAREAEIAKLRVPTAHDYRLVPAR